MSTQTIAECEKCGRPAGELARLRLDLGETNVCDVAVCHRCVVAAIASLAVEMSVCQRRAKKEVDGLRRMAGGRPPGQG